MDEIKKKLAGERLFTILNSVSPLSPGLTALFTKEMSYRIASKKTVLLRAGEISRHIYFIYKGSARSYFIDADGREHTSWFMGEDDIMVSVNSFFTQRPSTENIEVLENSQILIFNRETLKQVYQDFPEYNYHGRLFTEKYYMMAEDRAIILRTKNIAERYQLFLKTYPNVLQTASLGHIASFLGITKETLSRVRARR